MTLSDRIGGLVLAFGLLSVMASFAVAAAPSPVEGVWRTRDGSEVTIRPCPQGYCGYITRIVVPPEITARYGKELESLSPEQYYDANNPDPLLRSRLILGLQIIAMRQGSSPGRYSGRLYNPEDGNTYSGYLQVLGPDRLRLTGCVLLIFCRGEDWVRIGPAAGE